MKKVNFNQLKSVKTPESWVDRAINIPKEKKKIPLYRNPYIIASAACFVFCCALCSVIFASFNVNFTPMTAPPKINSTSNTVPDGSTPSYTNPSFPAIIQGNSANGENFTNPLHNLFPFATGSASALLRPSNAPSIPGQKPTATVPKDSEASSETGGSTGATGGTVAPTEPDIPSQPITEPSEATESPETPPTTPIEPEITRPWEPPTQHPTIQEETTMGAPSSEYYMDTISLILSDKSDFDINSNIYCHIESTSGKQYSVKYSNSELAYYKNTGKKAVCFSPIYKGIYIDINKDYFVTFYDSKGNSRTFLVYLGNIRVTVYE